MRREYTQDMPRTTPANDQDLMIVDLRSHSIFAELAVDCAPRKERPELCKMDKNFLRIARLSGWQLMTYRNLGMSTSALKTAKTDNEESSLRVQPVNLETSLLTMCWIVV